MGKSWLREATVRVCVIRLLVLMRGVIRIVGVKGAGNGWVRVVSDAMLVLRMHQHGIDGGAVPIDPFSLSLYCHILSALWFSVQSLSCTRVILSLFSSVLYLRCPRRGCEPVVDYAETCAQCLW